MQWWAAGLGEGGQVLATVWWSPLGLGPEWYGEAAQSLETN